MHFSFTLQHGNPFDLITLQIHHENGTPLLIPTSMHITADKWDPVRERPKNIYLKTAKKLNAKLDRLRIGLAEYLREVEQQKAVLSLRAVQRCIKKYIADDTAVYPQGSLLQAMQEYIESRTHLITKSTCKRYRVFLRLLERFEGHRRKRLFIEDANASFVKEFLEFGAQEQYSKSTIVRSLHFVSTILNRLEKRGIRTCAYEFEIPTEPVPQKNFVLLNEEELSIIAQTAVPEELKTAKDWLIISCYSGQRVSDFMNFDRDQLVSPQQRLCVAFVQQKTRKSVLLPLHPVVRNILKSHNGQFPEKLPYSKYNRQIKEVVRLAGITETVKVRKRRGFRAVETTVPKWKAVSSHIGRRSFATNFYGRIPTALLMEATGHSTEQMFQRYIGHANTSRAYALGSYFDQSYNKGVLVA